MKRGIKIILIVIGILAFLWLGITLFLRSYFTEERLKAMILPKAEELTGRKIQLDRIRVSLLKGVVAQGMTLKERDEQKDFLRVEQFILSYRLLPLLKKELVIKKIEVQSPTIRIIRKRGGRYNFSDMTERRFSAPSQTDHTRSPSIPFAIVSEKLLIRNAHLSFTDEEKEWPEVSLALDGEFRGVIGMDGKPQMKSGAISLKELRLLVREREIKISGTIEGNSQILHARLRGQVGKDPFHVTAMVKDFFSSPEIKADLQARTLDLQSLLALIQGMKESKKTAKEQPPIKGQPFKEGLTRKLRLSGQILIDSAHYQDYQFNRIRMDYQYVGGTMKVNPLQLGFISESSIRTKGSLQGDFLFSPEDLEKTLRGKAVMPLEKGSIQQSRIMDAIGSLMGDPSLKTIGFDQGLFHFDVKDQRVFLDGWVASNLFKLSSKGTVDFHQRLHLDVELRLSPELSRNLNRKWKMLKLIEDERGWKTIPLRIDGSVERPSVTVVLPEGLLEKGIRRSLKEGLDRFFLPSNP